MKLFKVYFFLLVIGCRNCDILLSLKHTKCFSSYRMYPITQLIISFWYIALCYKINFLFIITRVTYGHICYCSSVLGVVHFLNSIVTGKLHNVKGKTNVRSHLVSCFRRKWVCNSPSLRLFEIFYFGVFIELHCPLVSIVHHAPFLRWFYWHVSIFVSLLNRAILSTPDIYPPPWKYVISRRI